MRPLTFLVFLGMAFLLVTTARGEYEWKKFDAGPFSFSAPSSFKKTEMKGVDSIVGEYVANGINLTFDYGLYCADFEDWPEVPKLESLKVDGRAARIATWKRKPGGNFQFATTIIIHVIGKMKLSMEASCKAEEETAMARKIFESIRFPKD